MSLINDFHILCKNMYGFVSLHKNDCKVKLYEEQPVKNNCYDIIDSENQDRIVLVH